MVFTSSSRNDAVVCYVVSIVMMVSWCVKCECISVMKGYSLTHGDIAVNVRPN